MYLTTDCLVEIMFAAASRRVGRILNVSTAFRSLMLYTNTYMYDTPGLQMQRGQST